MNMKAAHSQANVVHEYTIWHHVQRVPEVYAMHMAHSQAPRANLSLPGAVCAGVGRVYLKLRRQSARRTRVLEHAHPPLPFSAHNS